MIFGPASTIPEIIQNLIRFHDQIPTSEYFILFKLKLQY
jgi:hypothetical protein